MPPSQLADEVEIEVYKAASTGNWHWRVHTLDAEGNLLRVVSRGCAIPISGKGGATRAARRDAKRWLRQEQKKTSGRFDSHRETVRLDGRPSRAQLERRIAELERELL